MIERLVRRVLARVRHRRRPLRALVAEVEAFIAEQQRAEDELVERSARYIEEREREEIARLAAEDEVARRLRGARVGARRRCARCSRRLGARARRRCTSTEGEGRPPGRRSCTRWTTCSGAWSRRSPPDDRKRLVTMLPGDAASSLQDGLCAPRCRDAGRDVFLGALVDCHAVAVKAGLRGLAALPDASGARAPDAGCAALERAVLPAGDLQVEEIRLRDAARQGAVRNVFTRTGIWTNLAARHVGRVRRGDGRAGARAPHVDQPGQGRLPLHQSARRHDARSRSRPRRSPSRCAWAKRASSTTRRWSGAPWTRCSRTCGAERGLPRGRTAAARSPWP